MKDLDFDELMKDHEFTKYSCAAPLIEDIRKLKYTDQAKVIKAYHKVLAKDRYWSSDMFFERFDEDYGNIDFKNLEETIEWIGYAINDLDNSLTCVDYNSPTTFFDVAMELQKVMEKCEKKA